MAGHRGVVERVIDAYTGVRGGWMLRCAFRVGKPASQAESGMDVMSERCGVAALESRTLNGQEW